MCNSTYVQAPQFFFSLPDLRPPFLAVFSLVPVKVKLRNAHGLQRREAGGPLLFKQVPLRKVPEKGMAVAEHQVNETDGETL